MITILAPVVRQKKGTYQQLFKDLNSEGCARVRVDGTIHQTDDEMVIDRLRVPEGMGQHCRRFIAYRVAEMRRISEPLDIGRVATIGALAIFLSPIVRSMVLRYPELQRPLLLKFICIVVHISYW